MFKIISFAHILKPNSRATPNPDSGYSTPTGFLKSNPFIPTRLSPEREAIDSLKYSTISIEKLLTLLETPTFPFKLFSRLDDDSRTKYYQKLTAIKEALNNDQIPKFLKDLLIKDIDYIKIEILAHCSEVYKEKKITPLLQKLSQLLPIHSQDFKPLSKEAKNLLLYSLTMSPRNILDDSTELDKVFKLTQCLVFKDLHLETKGAVTAYIQYRLSILSEQSHKIPPYEDSCEDSLSTKYDIRIKIIITISIAMWLKIDLSRFSRTSVFYQNYPHNDHFNETVAQLIDTSF